MNRRLTQLSKRILVCSVSPSCSEIPAEPTDHPIGHGHQGTDTSPMDSPHTDEPMPTTSCIGEPRVLYEQSPRTELLGPPVLTLGGGGPSTSDDFEVPVEDGCWCITAFDWAWTGSAGAPELELVHARRAQAGAIRFDRAGLGTLGSTYEPSSVEDAWVRRPGGARLWLTPGPVAAVMDWGRSDPTVDFSIIWQAAEDASQTQPATSGESADGGPCALLQPLPTCSGPAGVRDLAFRVWGTTTAGATCEEVYGSAFP